MTRSEGGASEGKARRVAGVAIAVMVGLSGCGGSRLAAPEGDPGESPSPVLDAETARMIDVYSTVVQQIVTVDHTFGGGKPPFERIFVVGGVVEDAGDPMAGEDEVGSPFPTEVKEGIERELRDVLPLEFVADGDSVIVNEDDCAEVRGNGVLISLGAIEGDGDTVEVGNGMFFACLGGQWLTYVVERTGEDWKVTGTTGPVAIS